MLCERAEVRVVRDHHGAPDAPLELFGGTHVLPATKDRRRGDRGGVTVDRPWKPHPDGENAAAGALDDLADHGGRVIERVAGARVHVDLGMQLVASHSVEIRQRHAHVAVTEVRADHGCRQRVQAQHAGCAAAGSLGTVGRCFDECAVGDALGHERADRRARETGPPRELRAIGRAAMTHAVEQPPAISLA